MKEDCSNNGRSRRVEAGAWWPEQLELRGHNIGGVQLVVAELPELR